MNRYCLLLPTYITLPSREEIARKSYKSLVNTIVTVDDFPLHIFAIVKGQQAQDAMDAGFTDWRFRINITIQPDFIGGVDQSLCYAMERTIIKREDMTHVIILSDDMLYHPNWFLETKALVDRHPNAKAWSTYRSAHTRHHRTLIRDEFGDHSVTSMAGHGMCFTTEEWKAWGVKSTDGQAWPIPTGGDTLDLHHAWKRPGERWATDKSYIQHLGVVGVHTHVGTPEQALEFVGEV